jgi:hypothetical protein
MRADALDRAPDVVARFSMRLMESQLGLVATDY